MKEIILGIILGVQGCIDLKCKEIPIWISLVGAGLGLVFCIAERRTIIEVFLACIPGIVFLVFSKLTKEVIGYGDGVLLFVMGLYLPLEKILSTGMLAFGIAGIVALVLLVICRKKGSYEIPFIPFLSFAYILEYFIEVGEVAV